MKNSVNPQKIGLGAGLAAGALAVMSQASAALDPAVTTGFTSLQGDFTALLAIVYPIAISISVALVVFGLVKMFIRRSAA